ncbi:MAG: hypothetical protein AAF989_02120 [Planctomycetota bacterium]
MSLLKLWNSIRGRSGKPAQRADDASAGSGQSNSDIETTPSLDETSVPDDSPSRRDGDGTGKSKKRKSAKPTPKSSAPAAISTDRNPADKAKLLVVPKRGLFAKGPHAALGKAIREAVSRQAGTIRIVEIGVSSVQRSEAILQAVRELKTPDEIRYSAVDTFEMGDGPITLKEFNALVRRFDVTPQLFPMPTVPGLTRLAHTLGRVDLIIDEGRFDQSPDALKLRPKMSHGQTVWLVAEDGCWSTGQDHDSGTSRRAA